MFKPYDPYQQINATPTPLLTIKRPDTFDLLMQENPGSDLSCFLLIAPIEEILVASENSGSDLSCFYMHTPGAIPITGSENPDTLISCVSLYHSPEIDIAISDAPDTLISCETLINPIEISITTGEEVGDAISCVSLFHMNSTSFALTDGSKQTWSVPSIVVPLPSYLRAVLLCTAVDPVLLAPVGFEFELVCLSDFSSDMPFGIYSDPVRNRIYVTYNGVNCDGNFKITYNEMTVSPQSWNNFSLKIYWY